MDATLDNQSFKDILLLIHKNLKALVIIFLLFLLTSIVYILVSEKYYESRITLYPAGELSEDNTFMSSFIAQSVGMGELYSPSYYIPDIIASRTLKESIIFSAISFNVEKITSAFCFSSTDK